MRRHTYKHVEQSTELFFSSNPPGSTQFEIRRDSKNVNVREWVESSPFGDIIALVDWKITGSYGGQGPKDLREVGSSHCGS